MLWLVGWFAGQGKKGVCVSKKVNCSTERERERKTDHFYFPFFLNLFSLSCFLLGCLNSWVGDKYCDTSCRIPACGYDAGDCGIDDFPELYSISLTEDSAPNQTFVIPLG